MKDGSFRIGLALGVLGLSTLPAPESAYAYGGSASAAARLETVAQRLAEVTNIERVRQGLAPLKVNDRLSIAAAAHAKDMARRGYFEHVGPGGKGFRERLELFGYLDWRSVAENIAAGLHTPSGAVTSWLNSPTHRANLLNASFSEIGVGYYESAGSEWKRYWVQDFGTRLGYYPVIVNNEAPRANTIDVRLYLHGEGWAEKMRLSNDRVRWTPWEPFSPTRNWQLQPGSGRRTVYAQISGDSGVFSSHDSIMLAQVTARGRR